MIKIHLEGGKTEYIANGEKVTQGVLAEGSTMTALIVEDGSGKILARFVPSVVRGWERTDD